PRRSDRAARRARPPSGSSGQGRVESATEGAVARGDRGTAIAQHPACVLVAQERGPGEAVQRDRVRRLLADPLDAQQLGAQRRIVQGAGAVRALRPPSGQRTDPAGLGAREARRPHQLADALLLGAREGGGGEQAGGAQRRDRGGGLLPAAAPAEHRADGGLEGAPARPPPPRRAVPCTQVAVQGAQIDHARYVVTDSAGTSRRTGDPVPRRRVATSCAGRSAAMSSVRTRTRSPLGTTERTVRARPPSSTTRTCEGRNAACPSQPGGNPARARSRPPPSGATAAPSQRPVTRFSPAKRAANAVRGRPSTSSAGPCSTRRPSSSTAIRSASVSASRTSW